MPRRTKQEAEQTRLKLIHTALMVFSDKGVAKTTLNDISSAAGVTKGAFYWHFKNKLEIFAAIEEEYITPIDLKASEIMTEAQQPVEGLLQSVTCYLSELENSKEMQAAFMLYFYKCEYTEEFSSWLKLDSDAVQQTVDEITQTLMRHPVFVERGEAAARQLATTVLDYLVGLMMRWVRDKQGSLVEQAMSGLNMLFKGDGFIFK